jgi:hypothetical protein
LEGQNLLGKTLIVISAKAEIHWFIIVLKDLETCFCRHDDTLMNPVQNSSLRCSRKCKWFYENCPICEIGQERLSTAAKGKGYQSMREATLTL